MPDEVISPTGRRRLRLWLEFFALYIGSAFALWLFVPVLQANRGALYIGITGVMLIGVLLLWRTPGFRWRELVDFRSLRECWRTIAVLSLLTAIVLLPIAWFTTGEHFFRLARENPEFLLLIWLLYPWVSVLGQEIVYRPLFFHRYAQLFPNEKVAIAVNALVFALAHVFFGRWITFLLTLLGGLMFALFYAKTRSFTGVFILHWIAGGLVFVSGLGWFFYHGAIGH